MYKLIHSCIGVTLYFLCVALTFYGCVIVCLFVVCMSVYMSNQFICQFIEV